MRTAPAMAMCMALALTACAVPADSTPTPLVPPGSAGPTPTASPRSVPPPQPTPTLAPGVTHVLELPFQPSGIVVDGGVIWAEDHARTNAVYAVDPDTGAVLARVNVTRPCDLAAGFGRVWVADYDAGSLLWIDPETRQVGGSVSGLRGPCGVQASEGAIWLAVDDGLARVDPATDEITVTELGDGAFPGVGLPLWAVRHGSSALLRIDPATAGVQLEIPHPEGAIEGRPLAVGLGALWVGSDQGRVYRLDATSGEVRDVIDAAYPSRLLVAGGAVWLTSFPDGVIERIDPERNEVAYRVTVDGSPNGIAEGLASIWVADTGLSRLYRIDPAATGIAR